MTDFTNLKYLLEVREAYVEDLDEMSMAWEGDDPVEKAVSDPGRQAVVEGLIAQTDEAIMEEMRNLLGDS